MLYNSARSVGNQRHIEKNSGLVSDSNDLPIWAGIQFLISSAKLPLMQVGFLPFLPHLVTDHSTVYTAMKNFVNVANQLERDHLPVFCDEEVYRIVLDIYLRCPQEFSKLIPMMGEFHMTKCVLHCIGKYIKGSELEDSLI